MTASAAAAVAVLPATSGIRGARAAVSSGAAGLRVGTITLRRCAVKPLTFCGGLAVPLDYSAPASPRIHLGFRWLPATGHAAGTILAVEGGPGYASTGSESQYLAMSGGLLATRKLLLIDLRGTGTSTPVNCPGLEHGAPKQSGRHFDQLVAACGAQLESHLALPGRRLGARLRPVQHRLLGPGRSAGVLRALRLGRVDLYGDSYGSWFAQVFASRYPGQLRSVTLDSTYQVLGLDPWYTTTVRDRPARLRPRRASGRRPARGDPRRAVLGADRRARPAAGPAPRQRPDDDARPAPAGG